MRIYQTLEIWILPSGREEGGGGDGVSKEICGTVRLPVWRHVTFKMASKVFIEETDKKFDFITEILFRFLGFGDFKVSTVIEN